MPLFMKRPVSAQIVEAIQLPAGAQASPTTGRAPRPGDWFVTDHQNGQSFAMTPDEFATAYEPLSIPSTVLAAEHQAQMDMMGGRPTYQPDVTYDDPRLPGFAGRSRQYQSAQAQDPRAQQMSPQGSQIPGPTSENPSYPYQPDDSAKSSTPATYEGSGEFQSKAPTYPGAGDNSPISQPMTEDLPGRPAPTPEVRPRTQKSGPIESPTGLPEQPADADKAYHESQSPTGQPEAETPA